MAISVNYMLLTVLAVDLLATSGDITMTWTSPMYSKLYSNDSTINPLPKPITKQEDAYIGSLITIGAMLGGIPFAYFADHYGRKVSLLGIGIIHIIAYVSMAFAQNVYQFFFGRIFGGLAVGGGYTILPMYIAEISEEHKRGFYSTTLGVFWGIGNFIPTLIGPFLSVKVFNLVLASIPTAFFVTFLLVGTETPFYLVSANKIEEAEKVLMKLRSKDQFGVQKEIKHIQDTLDREEEASGSLKDIFLNKGLRKAFMISIILIMLQQFGGWNAILFYLEPIFAASGTALPAYLSSLIVGCSILIFSLPVPYITDRFGRKTLIIFSCGVLSFCLAALGMFFFLQIRTDFNIKPISWIPLTSLLVMVCAFQFGMACIPWTISSELFPKNVKKLSANATSAACWISSFLMTQFFNDMTDFFGKDGTFFIFSSFSFVCVLFTIFVIPETRNKTFIEIQDLLNE